MKRTTMILAAAAILAAGSTAFGAPTWRDVALDSVIEGAFSYDASGDNVVVGGTAFRDTMGSTLSVQKIGGDGVNNPVAGNFAFYGAFTYTDTDNVLGWAQANPNTTLAIEVLVHTLYFDLNGNGTSDYDDYFALDARDLPEPYLTATFTQLGGWGCTEIADGIWMDIAVDSGNHVVAMSVVFEAMYFGEDDLNAVVLPGVLDIPDNSNWRNPSIRIAAVPVPGAGLLAGLGTGLVGLLRRRRHL